MNSKLTWTQKLTLPHPFKSSTKHALLLIRTRAGRIASRSKVVVFEYSRTVHRFKAVQLNFEIPMRFTLRPCLSASDQKIELDMHVILASKTRSGCYQPTCYCSNEITLFALLTKTLHSALLLPKCVDSLREADCSSQVGSV